MSAYTLRGIGDPAAYVPLALVAISGVLALAAHQADEAGHRRSGIAFLAATLAALVALVIGPLGLVGLVLACAFYGIVLGLPAAGVVILIRRSRRERP